MGSNHSPRALGRISAHGISPLLSGGRARADSALPTVIAGDFNEDKDGRAVQFLRKKGLRSALPEFSPSADTWRWTTSVGTIHSQLDHIAYDPRLVPLQASVLKRGRSDHWPVVAIFERSGP